MEAGFASFADGVASTLGSAATTGLNWSSAYVGQFPHLGVGLTVGAALIPYAKMAPAFTSFGVSIPSDLSFLQEYGIPLPALAADARIGGFLIPFDIGLKVGFIPDQLKDQLVGVSVDYLMFGADFRYAILDGKGMKPALSVGVGYTYYKGALGVPDIMGTGDYNMDITTAMNYAGYAGTHTLTMTSPELYFDWESNVIDVKAQLSKKILFITPSVGLRAAYAISTAGGGIRSTIVYAGSAGSLDAAAAALGQFGYAIPSATGINVSGEASGWAFSAFGGVSLNLFFLYLDANVNYNLLSSSLGGSVNLRVQL